MGLVDLPYKNLVNQLVLGLSTMVFTIRPPIMPLINLLIVYQAIVSYDMRLPVVDLVNIAVVGLFTLNLAVDLGCINYER